MISTILPTARETLIFAPNMAGATALGLQIGTGGDGTADYYIERGSKGYAYARYNVPDNGESEDTRTPAEDLAHIRAILRPTITELACVLGVSRQAVYDWQSDKPITAENAARLADLARAADVFAKEGLKTTSQILRRKITSDKNLLDIVQTGGSAEEAARRLIDIVRRELRQREALSVSLASRIRPPRKAFEDVGAPMLSEEV